MNGLAGRPGPVARRRPRPERRAARRAVPVEPPDAAGAPLGLRRRAAHEPAQSLRAARRRAGRAARLAARAGGGGALPRHRQPVRSRARRARRGAPDARAGAAAACTSTPTRPSCARSSGAIGSTSRSAIPPTWETSAPMWSRCCPSEGTIATERVLGIVSGTRSRALRAPRRGRAPGARRAGAAGGGSRAAAGARRDLRGARRGRLQDASASALAHARGERRGGPPGGRGGRHGLAGVGG